MNLVLDTAQSALLEVIAGMETEGLLKILPDHYALTKAGSQWAIENGVATDALGNRVSGAVRAWARQNSIQLQERSGWEPT